MEAEDNSKLCRWLQSAADLINTGVFWAGTDGGLMRAGLASVCVYLDAAMKLAHGANERIIVTDDVQFAPEGAEADLTALINTIRNCTSHVATTRRFEMPDEYFLMFVVAPEHNLVNVIQGRRYIYENPFPDDLALFFGPHRLLLKRNLLRAWQELVQLLPDNQRHMAAPTIAPPNGPLRFAHQTGNDSRFEGISIPLFRGWD